MKNLVKLLALGILIAFLAGCKTGTKSDSTVSPENRSGLLHEFIIMAYSGPPLEEVSLDRYQEIEEAGIEYLVPGNGTFNEEQNLRAMNLAQEAGFRIIPIDMRVLPFAQISTWIRQWFNRWWIVIKTILHLQDMWSGMNPMPICFLRWQKLLKHF